MYLVVQGRKQTLTCSSFPRVFGTLSKFSRSFAACPRVFISFELLGEEETFRVRTDVQGIGWALPCSGKCGEKEIIGFFWEEAHVFLSVMGARVFYKKLESHDKLWNKLKSLYARMQKLLLPLPSLLFMRS